LEASGFQGKKDFCLGRGDDSMTIKGHTFGLFSNIHIRKDSKILLISSFFAHFALGLLGPIYAIFVQGIGGDLLDAGIAYAIFSIFAGIFVILLGTSKFFAKHIRHMVVIGYALLSLSCLGYIFVQNHIQLFIVQTVLGIASGILEPSWDSLFSENMNAKNASKNWALWSGGASIMIGISAVVGSLIASKLSFQIMFIVMFIVSLVAMINSIKIIGKEK
jgi:predicted MFS family arabinose efflux permease